MDHILEFFHSEHNADILDVDIHMLKYWLVVAPPSKFHTVYIVLFHKYGGSNVAVTYCMSHFSMFLPTKATVKLANGNKGNDQGIGIMLCWFHNCSIIYTVGPVYYFPGYRSNTISSGSLKFYVGFQKVTSGPLEHCEFVDTQSRSWRSPYRTQNNINYIKIHFCQSKPSQRQEYCWSNCMWNFKTIRLSAYSSEFWSCLYYQTKTNALKKTHGRSHRKYPWCIITLTYLSLDQGNWNYQKSNH